MEKTKGALWNFKNTFTQNVLKMRKFQWINQAEPNPGYQIDKQDKYFGP